MGYIQAFVMLTLAKILKHKGSKRLGSRVDLLKWVVLLRMALVLLHLVTIAIVHLSRGSSARLRQPSQ